MIDHKIDGWYETQPRPGVTAWRIDFDSLGEFADAAAAAGPHSDRDQWAGDTFRGALKKARFGWAESLPETEAVVAQITPTEVIEHRAPVWDVVGSTVDIGAYLNGEPECMIEMPVIETMPTGRIVTICASMFLSASVNAAAMEARGRTITALCLALEQLGYNTELWLDVSAGWDENDILTIRTRVKGCNDTIDPSRILYAYAAASVYRHLALSVGPTAPGRHHGMNTIGGLGQPAERDLPDGTIYLMPVCSSYTYDCDAELRGYLRQLGIIES